MLSTGAPRCPRNPRCRNQPIRRPVAAESPAVSATGRAAGAACIHHRRRKQHPAIHLADPARQRRRHHRIRRRRAVPQGASPRRRRTWCSSTSISKCRTPIKPIETLSKSGFTGAGATDEQPRLGGARHRQAGRRAGRGSMLPVLKKPFETSAIQKIMSDLKIGRAPPPAEVKIPLAEALKNNWVEFWYQPKIELAQKTTGRRRSLRPRLPSPARRAPAGQLHAGRRRRGHAGAGRAGAGERAQGRAEMSQLGVDLRIAINVPVNAWSSCRSARSCARIVRR